MGSFWLGVVSFECVDDSGLVLSVFISRCGFILKEEVVQSDKTLSELEISIKQPCFLAGDLGNRPGFWRTGLEG